MKTKFTTAIQSFLLLTVIFSFAQNPTSQVYGGEILVPQNSQPCLTELQRNQIIAESLSNIEHLRSLGIYQEPDRNGTHPLFVWPVAQAAGHGYNKIYHLNNYIDHNTAFPNQITDYNCGTRSYDTDNGYNHKGFDIVSWPFWWKQMDLNQAINIAAADGQIISKNDGSFDRNCSFNTDAPNYIGLQHSDGSQSWYLHMKDGELTSKGVGDNVTTGEFLGVIGSSGSSTVPHLHFEVFNSAGELIDPSEGDCNTLNSDSWWINQKPYWEPGINAVLTHTDYPNFENCPNTEITNESDQFDPSDMVYYGIYLKDQRAGTQINLKTIRPDGSFQYDWNFDITDDLVLSYYIWIFPTDMDGDWTWEATYQGDTVSHTFNVGVLDVPENILSDTFIYPNPTSGKFTIDFSENYSEITMKIVNVLGQEISSEILRNQNNAAFEIEGAPGLYFITVNISENETKTYKVIKK